MKPSARWIGVLALAALAAGAPPAAAQSNRVGIVTAVHGQALLSRASLPEPTALRRRDDVFVADRITTGDRSFTRLLLGGKALVTVRERSTLTITETPGTSVVDVAAGAVAVSVVKERMRPGETVEIRTPNAVAGIRGTVVIAEVTEAGDRTTTTITVLRGLVEVRPLDGMARHPVGPGLQVGAAQMVRVSSLAPAARPVPTPVQPLTPDVRQRLNEAWKSHLGDGPSGAPPTIVETQKREAAAQVQRVLERRDEQGRQSRASGPTEQDTSGVVAGPRLSGGGSGSGSSGATSSGESSSLTSSGSTLLPSSGSTPTSSGSNGSSGSSGSSSLSSRGGGSSGSNSGSNSGSGLGLTRILDTQLRNK